MINSNINEISVWLDSLEDLNIDVSHLRLLSSYNYLANSLSEGCLLNYYPYQMSLYIRSIHQYINAYGNGESAPISTGDGYLFDFGFLDNYGDGPDNFQ